MDAAVVASLVFAGTVLGALFGMRLRSALPEHHLSADSKDLVRLCMGLIATMTALVLGLVTASAKASFDAQDAAVRNAAASVIVLDRTLGSFGPEAEPIRAELRDALATQMAVIWQSEPPSAEALAAGPGKVKTGIEIERDILALTPKTDAQRWVQSQALSVASDVLHTRLLSLTQATSAVPTPFLVVIALWLAVLFWSFGLFAPRNGTVVAALILAAASVSACVLLILEMQTPFSGILRVSSAPMHYVLGNLAR
jgi:hypothetical protein